MIDPQFEHYLREQPGLSYASSDQPWISRQVTRSIERGLGRRRLEAHYFALKAQGLSSQVFFQEALLRSGIELRTDFSPLEQIRAGRPLLFLANHPFGILYRNSPLGGFKENYDSNHQHHQSQQKEKKNNIHLTC